MFLFPVAHQGRTRPVRAEPVKGPPPCPNRFRNEREVGRPRPLGGNERIGSSSSPVSPEEDVGSIRT